MVDVIQAMTCTDDMEKFKRNVKAPDMLWSVKMDGVRTLAHDVDGKVSFWSRSKKPFPNFHRFAPDIANMADLLRQMMNVPSWWSVWFDGEMTAKSGEFRGVMQHLRRHKDVDPAVFEYHLFDTPTLEKNRLKMRLGVLSTVITMADPTDIYFLPHFMPVVGWNSIEQVFARLTSEGKEGIIIKDQNSFYEFREGSPSWLKMKKEHTLDLPVIGYKPGKGKYTGKVGALTCQLPNGKTVDVPGFSDADRDLFTMDLPEMIEVKHNGVTSGGKLRHPRFVCVREDK